MFCNKSVEQVMNLLKTSKNGLTKKEAESRKDLNNLNKLQEEKRTSFFKKFLKQFEDVMVIILLVSAILSIGIAISQKKYNDLFEGGIIFLIVVLNATMGVIQENKAENALANLKKTIEPTCKVLRDKQVVSINTAELVVGDIVLLESGNIVPADLRLIESHNLQIDESSLTGESVASNKNAEKIVSENSVLAEQINMAFSGTVVMVGRAVGVVVKIGKDTQIGKIAHLLLNGEKEVTPLQKSLNRIGKIISISVILISIIIFFVEILTLSQVGVLEAFMSAVALAVAAIPESLPAVITIIMALGVQRLAGKNAIIKRLHAVETLGNCQVICSDKTGTITQNKMTVNKCYYNNKMFSNNFNNQSIEFDYLIKCMSLCNDSFVENGQVIGEPTENALINFSIKNYKLFSSLNKDNKRIFEIPFTSDRKKMTVVVKNRDNQIISFTKGSIEEILKMSECICLNGKIVKLENSLRQEIINQSNFMTNNALRVLGFAFKKHNYFNEKDNFEQNLTFIGMVGLIDPPRPEVFSAVEKCFSAGLKPVMITGDHKNTAFAIAKEIGIAKDEGQVITGQEINGLTDKELEKVINKYTVFARVNPEHKVKIVKAFKKTGKIVAMTGDGVNDAPSLKIADIGIGMGVSGTEVSKDVADMILTDDNFATIIVAIEEGRKIYSNIQKTIQFLIGTNAVEVVTLFLSCIFFPNYIFLLPTQILFINFITDSLPAIGLGTESAEFDIMNKPPNKNNNIIDKRIGFNIFYQACIQIFVVMIVFIIGLKLYNNLVASTMCFFVINYMQLIHSINLKTNHSLKHINIFKNKTFNITFIIGMLLVTMVALLKPLHLVFGLCSLSLTQWTIVAIASVSIIPFVEICKKILNLILVERIK